LATGKGNAPAILAATLILASCSNAAPSATRDFVAPAPSPSASPVAVAGTPIAEVACRPNKNDRCAGSLAAGTHSSVLFIPKVTFEVPAGWTDHADSKGEYVLYAPGSKPAATEGGTRDWIAFEANTMMPQIGCAPGDPVDVGESAAAMASRMAGRKNLVPTTPRAVTVGGLAGWVVDVRLAENATGECSPEPGVALIHGVGISYGYDQGIGPGSAMRFYMFDRGDDVLCIEIDDISGGSHIEEWSAVVETVRFGG
jgi:hypothetical protein